VRGDDRHPLRGPLHGVPDHGDQGT
jgi:hypothetical protein